MFTILPHFMGRLQELYKLYLNIDNLNKEASTILTFLFDDVPLDAECLKNVGGELAELDFDPSSWLEENDDDDFHEV